MKSNKNFRVYDSGDLMKKATKLDPIKKSSKEKISLKNVIDDEEEDLSLMDYKKKESVLDYFDDGDEDDWDEGENDDTDEELDELDEEYD